VESSNLLGQILELLSIASLGEHDRVHHSEPASGDEDLVVGFDAEQRASTHELSDIPGRSRERASVMAPPTCPASATNCRRRCPAGISSLRQVTSTINGSSSNRRTTEPSSRKEASSAHCTSSRNNNPGVSARRSTSSDAVVRDIETHRQQVERRLLDLLAT